jgi:flagellar motor protein MotB
MFWAKRLKARSDDSSWAVPFGDLMSLLLAVFVMIASMSELRPGRRFDRIGSSIKSAFGLGSMTLDARRLAPSKPATLRERLEQGLAGVTVVRLADAAEEPLPLCEVVEDADRIIIRMAGSDAFLGPTGVAAPRTRKLLAVIADQLREGQARLEVRGFGPDGALPPGLPYRDTLEVAAERARAVCRELTKAGVAGNRLAAVACAEPTGGRGFEIVVRASPTTPAGRAATTGIGGKGG